MTRAEKKAKEIITTIQVVCIMCLLLIICYAIARETLGFIVDSKAKETTVVDCSAVPGTYYYEITVETESGERYAYYGDHREIGDTINVTFNGECITDAR